MIDRHYGQWNAPKGRNFSELFGSIDRIGIGKAGVLNGAGGFLLHGHDDQ
jgi:hypothetical protein